MMNGATKATVLPQVVRETLVIAAAGSSAALALVAVALIAGYLPARRAATIGLIGTR